MPLPRLTPGARAAVWWCAAWTCLAGPGIPAYVQDKLRASFGEGLLLRFVECADEVNVCNVTQKFEQLGNIAHLLRGQFNDCPVGCNFLQEYCDSFFNAMQPNMHMLRDTCAALDDWGVRCQKLLTDVNVLFVDPRFDISVLCSLISPGSVRAQPECRDVVSATVANARTLQNCGEWSRAQCMDNFCTVMATFQWRIRPRNLQEESARNRHAADFILPGCETVDPNSFDNATCRQRYDIQGFCDCLCEAIPTVEGDLPLSDCPVPVDEYLLFGRLGVKGVRVPDYCGRGLCKVFDQRRGLHGCLPLELPSETECLAMRLPQIVEVACPWLEDSGEAGVMECIDGHRCHVGNDGWDCCEAHLGRGKCPLDAPVMCDELCSGLSEYCCGQVGECEPRGCSPALRKEVLLKVSSTTTTTTSLFTGTLEEESIIRLPQGSWVWLLLFGPLTIGLGVVACWFRTRNYRDSETQGDVQEDTDRHGGFKVVRAAEHHDPAKNKPVVHVDVPTLPETQPLGLELLETRVVRLHAYGAKNGFQVGDVIVDIAGCPVSTFEEIWERIQVERERPPVRFTVERHGSLPEDVQYAFARRGRGARSPAAVAAAPASELRNAAAVEPGQLRGGWMAPAVLEAWAPPETSSKPQPSASPRTEETEEDEKQPPKATKAKIPIRNKSRFEEAFGDPKRDKLQEVIDKHNNKGKNLEEVRWVRDAWGRSVVKITS
mmetsp:Transcript_41448/g.131819  ORF Transcript_41448/g.131819 Transcript_41448/m.131819 type:complete len:717 (-) Transcript_41448:57-2207(-)